MQMRQKLMTAAAFSAALVLSAVIAGGAATIIEKTSRQDVRIALETAGHSWAGVQTDGLQVILQGTAPSEAERFRAVKLAGSVVEAARIVDGTDVVTFEAIQPPDFSLELLRNDDGISLIGLVPASTDREKLVADLQALLPEGQVADMLESADYPVPPGWQMAVDFALSTLKTLPRSKISVDPGAVAVQAIADSPSEKARIETSLARRRPSDLRLTFDISAPRPVITPFTLRFLIDEAGARFDACSADTERGRNRILAAARAAGAKGDLGCTIGMGVPSPDWARAVELSLTALAKIGAGTVTFSDADIALIAADSVAPADFDRAVGELESNLPEVFSLKAELMKKPETASAAPEFSVSRDAEGQVQLRGRVTDDLQRDTVESYARARFGATKVYGATRVDEALPPGWPVRTLAGIEALSKLAEGTVTVQPDLISVSGTSGDPQASDKVARVIAERLGESARMELQVSYDKRLDPSLNLPDGPECVARLNAVLTAQKITFEPGAATIAAAAAAPLDALAKVLKDCQDFRMELGGHTDSQGGEDMNQSLSRERAQAVLSALRDRRVLVGNITARGYGESQPIADNETEEGREANRRIEFVLLDAAPVESAEPAPPPAPEAAEPAAPEAETAPAPEAEAAADPDSPPMEDTAAQDEAAPELAPSADPSPAAAPAGERTDAPEAPAAEAEAPADLSPEVAAAQDPSIEIPVAPAAQSPGKPVPRPASLGPAEN